MTSSAVYEPLSVMKLGHQPLILLTAGNCLHKHQLVDFEAHQSKAESKSGHQQIKRYDIGTPFLFHKNSFYKNHKAENRPKIKNFLRITPGTRSRDL